MNIIQLSYPYDGKYIRVPVSGEAVITGCREIFPSQHECNI